MSGSNLPDEIEIVLPGGHDPLLEDQERRRHRIEMVKSWVNVVATILALGVGTAAVTKPEDPTPKVSYEELRKVVEKNEQDNLRNHEDVAALRAYIEGYTRAAPPPPSVPSAAPARGPASRGAIRALTPPAPSMVPEVHRPSESTKLPEYDTFKK